MQGHRWIAGLLAGLLLAVPAAAFAQQGEDRDIPESAAGPAWRREGTAYCFQRQLRIGSIVVQGGGRCYNFYLFRDGNGVFLGLGPGGVPVIQPGRVIQLGSPQGAQLRRLLRYLIPLTGNVNIGRGTIIFAPVQAAMVGNRVMITLPERGVSVGLEAK